jgi:protein SCO1/2
MFLLLSCLLMTTPAGQPPAPRLAVIGDAPDFTLVDQDGKTVQRADFKGKVLLVSFVFTTCNGTCPATTHRLAKVHQLFKSQPGNAHLAFLTITLDPQRDTPEALRKYIQLYDLETKAPLTADATSDVPWIQWTFLTGSPEVVAKTIAAWGMWVKPAPNGQLDHPSRIFLVDRQGKIREIYNVDLLRPGDVVDDINELWREKRK